MDCRSRTVGTLYAGAWRAEANTLIQTNLVSDISGLATITDPSLQNPWGMSHTPPALHWPRLPAWLASHRQERQPASARGGRPRYQRTSPDRCWLHPVSEP